MQWEIIYETPESEFDIRKNLPRRSFTPPPQSLTDVLEAVRFLLLRHRPNRITITRLNGKDSK